MTQQAFIDAALQLTPADIDYIKTNTTHPEPVSPQPERVAKEAEPASESTEGGAEEQDGKESNSKRRRVHHVWPDIGSVLTVDYFGTTYEAEIIPASKKLKSGKQVKLTTGPAAGTICDSLSEAMLTATEKQRNLQKLGRKQAANGWDFWSWPGKAQS